MQIILSFSLLNQLSSLNHQERSYFLGKIKEVIITSQIDKNLREYSENNQSVIVNINYYSSHHVIGALIPQQSTVRIIAFTTHNKEVIENQFGNSQIINLTIENHDQSFLELIINQPIWQSNSLVFKSEDFEKNHQDFYVYSLNFSDGITKEVFLSPQQYNIITNNSNLPILLSGDKGSGKTLTALYSALKHSYDYREKSNAKILFITANQHLQNNAKKIVKEVSNTSINNLIVKDYKSLAKSFGNEYQLNEKNQFLAQRQIIEHKFVEKFCKEQKLEDINYILLWQEIRQIIKGTTKSLHNPDKLLTLNDYLTIKNQSFFPVNTNFEYIYNLATQYQKWLKVQNYWDRLDLVHHLYNNLPDNYQGDYDVIYVDDSHQLTEIEIQFIFKLLKIEDKHNYIPQLFFVGEDNFVVNQRGFNWGRVKKIAVEEYLKSPQWKVIRSAIEPQSLSYSFKVSDKIVSLNNSIVNLAAINVQSEEKIPPQFSYVISEVKPLIIAGVEEEILKQDYRLGAGNGIIVATEKDKQKLVKCFPVDSQRIVTIEEAQGLEFEEVLVWQFFSNLPNLINQEENFLLQKYRYLSGCIKTAKTRLYFYDSEVDEFWNLAGIGDLVEIGYLTELDYFFEENNNRDISETIDSEIIDSYLSQGNSKAYQIASQLYFRGNDMLGAAKVEALLEEVYGNWGRAGDIWNQLLIFDEAIRCWNEVDKRLWEAKWASSKKDVWSQRGQYFEQIKNYQLASFCYEKGNDFQGKLRCLEGNNQWELAGDKCRENNLISQADQYYDLAHQYYLDNDNFKASVQMWTKLNKLDRVALIWEGLGEWEKAGNCWQKQGEIEKAAFCWQKAQKWSEAQKCWLELERWQDLALSYESQQRWDLAAQTWVKQGEIKKAACCYQYANRWDLAENLWRDLQCWGYVAIALQQQNKWLEAAKEWEKTNTLELQALCYEQLKNWQKAEESWLKANNWHKSIICAQKQEKWLEAAESWENLGEWLRAGKAWEKITEIEKAALCYEQGEYWEEAQRCWTILNSQNHQSEWQSAIARCLEKQQKCSESAQIWQKLGQWQSAGKAWQNTGEIKKAALCYEKGEHWREAEECWRTLGDESKTQAACIKQGEWQTAANDWLKVNQIEQAALCYEKCQDWERAEKYWRQLSKWEKLAPVCEAMEKWDSAAQAYLNSDNPERAAFCYEQIKDWEKAEECWRKAWKWEQLALVCEYQNKWQEAATAWVKADNLEKAAIYYEQIEDWENAEECWRKLSNWERLAAVCENQHKWEESAQLWNFLEQWQKAAQACLQMDDIETAIKYYEKGGYTKEINQLRNP